MQSVVSSRLASVVNALLVFLFVYTGASKLLDPEPFRAVISRFPVVGGLAGLLWWALPVTEIVFALLVLFPKTRIVGLTALLLLLVLFSLYIAILLLSGSRLPCSCGGVLKGMGWTTHLAFNLLFAGGAAWSIRHEWQTQRRSTSLRNKGHGRHPYPTAGPQQKTVST